MNQTRFSSEQRRRCASVGRNGGPMLKSHSLVFVQLFYGTHNPCQCGEVHVLVARCIDAALCLFNAYRSRGLRRDPQVNLLTTIESAHRQRDVGDQGRLCLSLCQRSSEKVASGPSAFTDHWECPSIDLGFFQRNPSKKSCISTWPGQPTVVINSPKVASELLERRASSYSDRPRLTVAQEIRNNGLAFTRMNFRDRSRRCA
ncbi:hypothetical protein F5148DRAFT_430573, partial [Russula earlei]